MKQKFIDQYIHIGINVSYYRRLAGMTQEQLAERVGISSIFLGHIEASNMAKGVSLDTLMEIAEALNIPLYKLLRFED